MTSKGIPKSATTYGAAIGALARAGDWDGAIKLLKQMEAEVSGLRVDSTPT